MEQVFASAYCTIAATSASDSRAGFLAESVNNQGIYVLDASEQCLYVSTNVADFDEDVNAAELNKRAWVMQERYLSPRTIHFTSTQDFALAAECLVVAIHVEDSCSQSSISWELASSRENESKHPPILPDQSSYGGRLLAHPSTLVQSGLTDACHDVIEGCVLGQNCQQEVREQRLQSAVVSECRKRADKFSDPSVGSVGIECHRVVFGLIPRASLTVDVGWVAKGILQVEAAAASHDLFGSVMRCAARDTGADVLVEMIGEAAFSP
ncbi:Uu.00g061380.m01.CDS01 [Anthostomella pinea]|uniref:Uu.00g061380.m01.CDS01 n=1 Tax=Anthostomella pinea TaxID=933095 RepID=A0AAI8VSH7_9PEZI|nr:Uu.00g061380.m01.CDS01 [Anthostomella pinea]